MKSGRYEMPTSLGKRTITSKGSQLCVCQSLPVLG